jgi:tetratricopeptide (TPR) repeat protein
VLAEVGRDGEAAAALTEALRLDPVHPEAWTNRAHLYARAGNWEQARQGYRQTLRQEPDSEQACRGLQAALIELGEAAYRDRNWDRAAEAFEELVSLAPGQAGSHYRLAWVRTAQRRLPEARSGYEQALSIQPDLAEAWNNLGHVHTGLGELELALNCYRRALAIRPEYADALYNLGATLQGLERWEEADQTYSGVLALNPRNADAHNNRGGVSLAQRCLDEALRHYERAIEIQPGHHDARWNRALANLTLGNFRDGWVGYETRLERKSFREKCFRAPRWQGEDLVGKTVLVWAEQGLGDTIQFARYLPLMEEQGAKVLLEVHPRLQPLFPGSHPFGEVVEKYDYYVPLLSLPYHFATVEETIPKPWNGLVVSAECRQRWREKIAGPGLAVGLVWHGNPENWKGRKRSIPADVMLSIGPVCRVRFFNLQWGPEGAAIQSYPYVLPLEEGTTSIMDTAAMVSELDLVITVDTMMAHLAGTLGKPVWVLLHTESDWRWMLDREDSPWYPSMRLFRQLRGEEWGDVIRRVRSALAVVGGGEGSSR